MSFASIRIGVKIATGFLVFNFSRPATLLSWCQGKHPIVYILKPVTDATTVTAATLSKLKLCTSKTSDSIDA